MLIVFILTAFFVFIPSAALAWGPLTHAYLGTEIFYVASLLPVGVAELLRRYRQDYLYGNLMADIVLAKKYQPAAKSSHSWDFAAGLMEEAGTDSERAFCLGYMSHLAADTVAHGRFTAGMKNLEHTFLEIGADSLIDKACWSEAIDIDKKVQTRNDALLEKCLDVVIFSFKTNKKFFMGALALQCFNTTGISGFFSNDADLTRKRKLIEGLHEKSLDRILDVLSNGTRSTVLKKSPIADLKRGRLFKALLR
jgi:hypothetical protein